MKEILRTRFSNLTTSNGMAVVFDNMDPSYVGALGAARAVRAKVENMEVIYDVIEPVDL
jgi:hypothetical protein